MIIVIIMGILVISLAFLYFELETLTVSSFRIKTPKINQGDPTLKIVHLSDLHSKEFGKNNHRLIKKIRQLEPDLMITTGDMITSTDHNGDAFLNVVMALSDEIPICYIEGNHELTARYDTLNLKNGWYDQYLNDLKELGVTILQNETIYLTLKGIPIGIQGLTVPLAHYCAVPESISNKNHMKPLNQVSDVLTTPVGDQFNILLAHNPFLAPIYDEHGVDLICCGHVHGGAVRLPFLGGLLSPERKLFPKYSAGLYRLKQSSLIVSRGLGRLRLFNCPDIVLIEIRGK